VTSDLDGPRIEQALERDSVALGRPLSIVDVTGSTNDDAKAAAHRGIASGAAFVADTQTAGRAGWGACGIRRPARTSTSRSCCGRITRTAPFRS
jgi:hypothetical protein